MTRDTPDASHSHVTTDSALTPVRSRFTLIELLVVVSIIAILAGMLLPVLSKARYKARQTKDKGAYKQLTLGYIMYTDDNDDYFPQNDYKLDNSSQPFSSNVFMRNQNTHRQFDVRPVAVNYGFMSVTGCVMTGAPGWDDEGNDRVTYLNDNRRYAPADYYNELSDTDKRLVSPLKVTQGGGTHIVLSTYLRQQPNGLYVGSYVENGKLNDGPNNTSAIRFSGTQPQGVVSSRFDGSVHWVDFNAMAQFGSTAINFVVPNEE